jgi:hypothetical protein
MDSIYTNAYFTIVAADSESAECGIHGVSVPRKQPRYQDGETKTEFSFRVLKLPGFLAKTIWASRAWTYQESVLSRRLLVFTVNFCCLICPKKVYREDFQLCREGHRVREREYWHPPWTFLKELPEIAPGFIDSHFADAITEYTTRSLSMPEDTLRAFGGIMSSFEHTLGSFHWGLPRKQFLESLWWTTFPRPTADYSRSTRLCADALRRNDRFPSWTWAGWTSHPRDYITIMPVRKKWAQEAAIFSIAADDTFTTVNDYCSGVNDDNEQKDNVQKVRHLPFQLESADKQEILCKWHNINVPRESVLIFRTVVVQLEVKRKEQDTYSPPRNDSLTDYNAFWPSRPGNTQDRLLMGKIELDRSWRALQGEKLDFGIIGLDVSPESGCITDMLAMVLSREGDISFRAGIARISAENILLPSNPPNITIDSLAAMGKLETIILG